MSAGSTQNRSFMLSQRWRSIMKPLKMSTMPTISRMMAMFMMALSGAIGMSPLVER